MGMRIADSFQYLGDQFLDARTRVENLSDIPTLDEVNYPNGFRIFCDENASWYALDKTATPTIDLGRWHLVGDNMVASDSGWKKLSSKANTISYRKCGNRVSVYFNNHQISANTAVIGHLSSDYFPKHIEIGFLSTMQGTILPVSIDSNGEIKICQPVSGKFFGTIEYYID